ncbi:MAG TPA: family 20 glycosylhydrolase [Chthonomonadaceae bacterium]|nr:family 20 glycosylhydrolase [Chthonomonadaceae bacterium]
MEAKIREERAGVFRCTSAPQILVGDLLRASGSEAAQPLLEQCRKQFHSEAMQPAAPETRLPEGPFVLVGLVKDHPALKQLEADLKSRLPKDGLGQEGYLLEVAPERILIAAEKPAGAYYGVLKLLERAGDAAASWDIPAVRIADWPTMRWRGMHVLVNSRDDLPAVEQLLTRFLPQYRLNRLILEINYNFQFRSHPEISSGPNALTVEDCRRLSALAKQNNVHLIPMLNCLGHQSWAETTGAFLRAHPEFDETPDLPANNPGIYCRSWCPSHPDVNKVVFDLFDELIDAFDADAFHVGMDEVFILGQCPRCKGKANAELFARAVNDYHSHLAGKRKVQMLMWGDRLLDDAQMHYGEWESSRNDTAPALHLIPKDIVICDWHYEPLADFPSVKYFQEQGFAVWPSGWNSEENAQRLAGCALKNTSDRMLGYLATTWVGVRSVAAGLAGDAQALTGNKNVSGVVAAIRKGARLAWEGAPQP